MTTRNSLRTAFVAATSAALLAQAALASGEPKNQWPFARAAGGRTLAANATKVPSPEIRGEPKNQLPFTRRVATR